MIKKLFFCSVLICMSSVCAFSQQLGNSSVDPLGRTLNTITTAVPFLLIAPDSRAGGMGDMGAATSADVNSQAYNPSKYVFNKNKFGISISYSPWLRQLVKDINLAYLAAYYKITDKDAISFSLRYFSLGNISFTDMEGNPLGDQRPNEFAIDLGYSRKLTEDLSISITPRFIYSNLTAGQFVNGVESKAGLAGAADLSLFYQKDLRVKGMANSTLRFGFNISNMGNKISYSSGYRRDFLPTNLKIGLSYTMEFDQYNKLMFGGEINKLLVPTPPVYEYAVDTATGRRYLVRDAAGNPVIYAGKDPNVSVFTGMIQSFYDAPAGFREEMREIAWALGLEYVYRDLLFVRAGYFHESKYKGNRQYFTVGVGIKYNVFAIDMAYLITTNQHHPLENTLRFTLTFDFGGAKKGSSTQTQRR